MVQEITVSKISTIGAGLCRNVLFPLLALILLMLTNEMAYASPLTEYLFKGNKITYLGRSYNAQENITSFRYRLSRGLVSTPATNTEILYPATEKLVRVDSTMANRISVDAVPDYDAVILDGSPLPGIPKDVKLDFLGEIQEGGTAAKLNLVGGLTATADIFGPALGGLDLQFPTGTPVPALPECLLDTSHPLVATVGQALDVVVPIQGALTSLLNFTCENWPAGATCTSDSGSSIHAGDSVRINWTPTQADVGIGQTYPLRITSTPGVSVLCNVNINVIEDLVPVIHLEPLGPLACQGAITKIVIDASGSFDPEGKPLDLAWNHNCQGGVLESSGGSRNELDLTLPFSGIAQSCSVTLLASDGVNTTTETVNINVGGCNTNCDASQKDACGVCNGQNLCVDCEGIAYGRKSVDRCGVCGGFNDCVDCRGQASGGARKDICGVCEGDSSSCRSCQESNLQSVLATLDGSILTQSRLVTKSLRRATTPANAKLANSLIVEANKLYTETWTLVWGLNQKELSCSHYAGCTNFSSNDAKIVYSDNSKQLRKVALEAAKLIAVSGIKNATATAAKVRRQAKRLLNTANQSIKLYPNNTHQCG